MSVVLHDEGLLEGPPLKWWIERTRQEAGCVLWSKSLNAYGYGTLMWKKRYWYAHRLAYAQFVGTLIDGLTIDHLCRRRDCVNPDHLEQVPVRINLLRGEGFAAKQARQTHCHLGHPLSGDNLLLQDGHRYCRICRRRQNQEFHARRYERTCPRCGQIRIVGRSGGKHCRSCAAVLGHAKREMPI